MWRSGAEANGNPVITVITVTRNAKETIARTIGSVIEQTYPHVEYIIVDGASTDGTIDIVRGFGDRIHRFVSEPDRGLYDAMNKGLRLARGEYVNILNSDDHYCSSTVLQEAMQHLQEDSVCYGALLHERPNGRREWHATRFRWQTELRASRIPQQALFVPRALYQAVGEFDLRYKVAADYEMFLRLSRRFPVKLMPVDVTVMYAGGFSYRNSTLAFQEARRVSCAYGLSTPIAWALYGWRRAKWLIAHGMLKLR
jgi:glycosyltransferase involved in cell wall biosynthesis